MGELLRDKVAIITGGAGGIGSRIARAYALEGARVVVASRKRENLDVIVDEIVASGGEALAVATDVTSPEDVEALVQATEESFGAADILINNAGGAMFMKPPEKLKPEEWDATIALNLSSVFFCSQAVSHGMIEKKGGKIINISSVAGIRMSPAFIQYGAAKAGVINLTKSLASCWGPYNINVNCIAPGLTATEGVAHWLPSKTDEDGNAVPSLQLPPEPEHVAQLAVFLASEASSNISGELFPIRSLTELA